MVAPKTNDLSLRDLRRGIGISVSVLRANVLAFRADFSLAGGEKHPHFLTPGKAFGF